MKNQLKDFVKAILLIIVVAILLAPFAGICQTVKPADKVLKDTVIKTVTYKLYVGAKGGRYVIRTSASGNVYKQYIKANKGV